MPQILPHLEGSIVGLLWGCASPSPHPPLRQPPCPALPTANLQPRLASREP